MTKSNWSQFFFFPLRFVHAWLPFFRAFSRTLFLEVLATVPFVPGTFAFFFSLRTLVCFTFWTRLCFQILPVSAGVAVLWRKRERQICIFLGECLGVLWLHCFCLRFCGLFLARYCTAWYCDSGSVSVSLQRFGRGVRDLSCLRYAVSILTLQL